MNMKKSLGKRLKDLRNARGLTQEQFAEQLGVSAGFISQCECGVYYPSMAACERLTEAFGITMKELFDFADPKPVEKSSSRDVALNRLAAMLAQADAEFINAVIGVVKAMRRTKGQRRQPAKPK
ncbi:MAG: helix-turn-helix transcriptional regulator [Ignavibacteriae bacterium]|nr:helix-turn-helix transcriptional regulator [Ignavibacteriota bacterium]